MTNYDFLAPRKIVFGWGRRSELGGIAEPLGKRAFLVTGSRTLEKKGIFAELADRLHKAGIEVVRLASIEREPEVEDVDRAVAEIRRQQPGPGDFVMGCGGGSALDLAKAVAALATNREGSTVRDYLEGVGRGLQITTPPLPVLALPTTAGTGTEATKNAVISSYDPPFKKSLRSHLMVPAVVLVDPELTVTLPPATTAYTGMDAITQLIESYLSRNARPIPQALCVQGLELALDAIVEAVGNGSSRPAREKMSHAAMLSGLALANSGLGLAHGVAAALGVHCRVPHGLACAVMLPVALKFNLPRSGASRRLPQVFDGIHGRIDKLCERLTIPSKLSALGVTGNDIPALVKSSRGNSMSGNPRDVSDDELTRLLEDML